MSDDPDYIWLEPRCAEESYEGRSWCQDDVWGKCDECDLPAVKYVRADLVQSLERQLATMRVELAATRAALEPSDRLIKRWVKELWREAKTGGGWQPGWDEIIRAGFRCARAALAPRTETESDNG